MTTDGDRILILDGGMGKELRRIGAPFRQPEWSALALIEAPDLVARAHRNFIEAGAQVIITNAYAVVPFHIGDDRFVDRGAELAELAARIAAGEARRAERPVEVAASLPPVFGSYEPDAFEADRAPDRWQVLIDAQAEHVDLWVAETMSSIVEFTTVESTLTNSHPDRRLWASFTLADHPVDGRAVLRSGETMAELAAAIMTVVAAAPGVDRPGVDRPGLEAVLFNCSQPEVITPALAELSAALADLPPEQRPRLGAYANAFPADEAGGDEYAANERIIERRPDLTPEVYADLAAEWVAVGATIIGGCCDIYPDHIAALARRFPTDAQLSHINGNRR